MVGISTRSLGVFKLSLQQNHPVMDRFESEPNPWGRPDAFLFAESWLKGKQLKVQSQSHMLHAWYIYLWVMCFSNIPLMEHVGMVSVSVTCINMSKKHQPLIATRSLLQILRYPKFQPHVVSFNACISACEANGLWQCLDFTFFFRW